MRLHLGLPPFFIKAGYYEMIKTIGKAKSKRKFRKSTSSSDDSSSQEELRRGCDSATVNQEEAAPGGNLLKFDVRALHVEPTRENYLHIAAEFDALEPHQCSEHVYRTRKHIANELHKAAAQPAHSQNTALLRAALLLLPSASPAGGSANKRA